MILTNVSDTIHADSLALFALDIEIVLADITKPEKSNMLISTWPVTSSVTSRSYFRPCLESVRTRLSNGAWIVEIGLVVWEITGGSIRPPHTHTTECVTRQSPTGRGLTYFSQYRYLGFLIGNWVSALCASFMRLILRGHNRFFFCRYFCSFGQCVPNSYTPKVAAVVIIMNLADDHPDWTQLTSRARWLAI